MREIIVLFILFTNLILAAQISPKEEFRGVWIASVANIDYPQAPTADAALLKEEWIFLLDELQQLNINAVIVQVRPAGDALYPSAFAPWSAYLTGQQGLAPQPYFDPLEFMIESAHARNMEFHAWLNPYRATMNMQTQNLHPTHGLLQNPTWHLAYGGKYYLDPGLPEVQQHITDIVAEVTENYDIDAVHFDDYFYPYKSGNEVFPDYLTYQKYGAHFSDRAAFRVHSVNRLIDKVSAKIKEIKPHVRFGISPFGVWRNAKDDLRGSDSRAGVRAYDDLHAHIVKWLREGKIDYIAPQLYWSIGYAAADYKILLDWWTDWHFGRNLYAGHAVYKIDNNADPAWADATEIPRQVLLNRASPETEGSIHFSASKMRLNPLNILQSLGILYERYAKIPESIWLEVPPAVAPEFSEPSLGTVGITLNWKKYKGVTVEPYYYIIYRFPGEKVGDLNDARNILHITAFGENVSSFTDEDAEFKQKYTYVVTAVNRAHSESGFARPTTVMRKKRKVKVF